MPDLKIDEFPAEVSRFVCTVQAYLHVGMLVEECRQSRQQPLVRKCRCCAHRKRGDRTVSTNRTSRFRDPFNPFGNRGKVSLSRFRQHNTAPDFRKERHAELRFQGLNLLRNGGWGDTQFLCGPRDAACPGRCMENPNAPDRYLRQLCLTKRWSSQKAKLAMALSRLDHPSGQVRRVRPLSERKVPGPHGAAKNGSGRSDGDIAPDLGQVRRMCSLDGCGVAESVPRRCFLRSPRVVQPPGWPSCKSCSNPRC